MTDNLKMAGALGLTALGLTGLSLYWFATRRTRYGVASLGGAGLAWFFGHQIVKGAVASQPALRPAAPPTSSIDWSILDSLPWK